MEYRHLVEVYEKLSSTSKRLEKTYWVAQLLKSTSVQDLDSIILLLQGRIFPIWDEQKIGVAIMMVQKAITLATGATSDQINTLWKETGDLGLVAQKLVQDKKQQTLVSKHLEVKDVFETIQKLAKIQGAKSVDTKLKLIAGLLSSSQKIEAQYIARTLLEDLRIGVGEGVLRDAIAWAYAPNILGIHMTCPSCAKIVPFQKICFDCNEKNTLKYKDLNDLVKTKYVDSFKICTNNSDMLISTQSDHEAREMYNSLILHVQEAFDITNDFAKVASIMKKDGIKGLGKLTIKTGIPLNLMLYPKAVDIQDGFKQVGKPAALEYKYDGFRTEIHVSKGQVKIFTRRLEEVTLKFPDIVALIKENVKADECILDAEILGIDPKTGKSLPFQNISKRIKRKHDIEKIAKEIPVWINIFDIILYNNKNLLKESFEQRRSILQEIVKQQPLKLNLAQQLVTDDVKVAEKFYKQALNDGHEGIMMKNLSGIYKPGKRVSLGVKVKPVMETLDLVIVGAQWGEGKRVGAFTSFTLACRDEDDNLLELGNMSTGLKEKQTEDTDITYTYMTKILQEHIEAEKGKQVRVRPAIVIEVHFEEIQISQTNDSGYALRFPRFVRLREDRSPHEISDIHLVENLFKTQRNRQ